MKFFVVLSLVIGSALAEASTETSELQTGSNGSNALINTTFGESKYTLLQMAIFLDHEDHVAPLIQKGANVNTTATDSSTPLYVAVAYNESGNVTRLLIENGADVNAKMKGKMTLLHFAYLLGRQNNINLLINNGADQEAIAGDGKKPKEYENDRERPYIINGINEHKRETKQLYEGQYNSTIKALGIV